VFNTYDFTAGFLAGNNSSLFGGVMPQIWSDGNGTANMISADKDLQRALFNRKAYPGKNALVYAETWYTASSTDGKLVVVLFRVKNTTASAIAWTPNWYTTCYGGFNEFASLALNGANTWQSGGCSSSALMSMPLSIPANRTSTVVFVSSSAPNAGNSRSVLLAFANNSLDLPAGLEFVDDLDTATGDYSQ
jgi:hypothetical protein